MSQNIKVTPQDVINAKNVVCDQCSSETFNNVFLMKTISALLSPTGKELNLPIPVFSCTKCGHVNKAFMPENMQG